MTTTNNEERLRKGARLCKNSEAHPYVGVEREQHHSILELDDQFFDFSHRLERFCNDVDLDVFAVVGGIRGQRSSLAATVGRF